MSTTGPSVIDEAATRLFGAIERGDIAAIHDLWSDDVVVWKVADRDRGKGQAVRVIEWFIGATSSRRYETLDRQTFDGGFVQQHILHADGHNGASIALRVCIVIKWAKAASSTASTSTSTRQGSPHSCRAPRRGDHDDVGGAAE